MSEEEIRKEIQRRNKALFPSTCNATGSVLCDAQTPTKRALFGPKDVTTASETTSREQPLHGSTLSNGGLRSLAALHEGGDTSTLSQAHLATSCQERCGGFEAKLRGAATHQGLGDTQAVKLHGAATQALSLRRASKHQELKGSQRVPHAPRQDVWGGEVSDAACHEEEHALAARPLFHRYSQVALDGVLHEELVRVAVERELSHHRYGAWLLGCSRIWQLPPPPRGWGSRRSRRTCRTVAIVSITPTARPSSGRTTPPVKIALFRECLRVPTQLGGLLGEEG